MSFYVFALVCMSLAAIHADDAEEPCCLPVYVTADVFKGSKKQYTLYVDYELSRVLEDWGGYLGNAYVFYDRREGIRYKLKTNGECFTSETRQGAYEQCIPEDAKYHAHDDVDGKKMSGFKFSENGVKMDTVFQQGSCLPQEVTKSKGHRTLTLTYKNAKASVDDQSVFEIDFSACDF